MGSSELSVLSFVSFLLLAALAEVAGGELATFIVHVQPQEGQVLASADDRDAWYRSFLPEDGRRQRLRGPVDAGGARRAVRGARLRGRGPRRDHARNWSTPVTVERAVRNVGEVPSVYYAAVDMFDGDVTVEVVPRELEFSQENQEQRFEVVVWARRNGAKVVQGALRLVSDTYTVRSPISIFFP
ncbi:subtilisin-like protease [Panicum miliaceum]|uniref:Subtilisin-like protease n=1 Tax=Panicum miliaceum TaxID=4540 RepID=A0A3L6TLP3_PANMI|nr:subtilisin-like protease [Panicum miliaceum]